MEEFMKSSDDEFTNHFELLKPKYEVYHCLERFTKPDLVSHVVMTSDEVTALCSVTNQPDWYTVEIYYEPQEYCIESKSLKLYLHSLRSIGIFCESLSEMILKEISEAISPRFIRVTVTQKPRGGISIKSVSELRST